FAERAKERKVLSDLRGGGPSAPCQLVAGDRDEAALRGLLEESQVKRKSSDGRVGDTSHGQAACEIIHKLSVRAPIGNRSRYRTNPTLRAWETYIAAHDVRRSDAARRTDHRVARARLPRGRSVGRRRADRARGSAPHNTS